MIIIEIEPNPNCDPVDMRIFHDIEPPRRVTHVRRELTPGQPKWYEVTGWMADGKQCPALVQKVDDSGEGVALLVHGGDAGLRFRPEGNRSAWSLDDSQQWGEPFFLTTDATDLRSEP